MDEVFYYLLDEYGRVTVSVRVTKNCKREYLRVGEWVHIEGSGILIIQRVVEEKGTIEVFISPLRKCRIN